MNLLDINRKLFEETMTRRMFFVPSFEMYGGVKGLYDFGLPGSGLKNNLLQSWRQHFVMHDQMLEIDSVGLTPESVLEVSGHVAKFADWLVYDLKTGEGYRADHLVEEHMDQLLKDKTLLIEERNQLNQIRETTGNMNGEQLDECIQKYGIKCKETGNEFSKCVPFNMMFKTSIGPTGKLSGYLRPETAQGIF